MAKEGEYEMAPRVERIEQQIPVEWKEFAGKPMQMAYYATKVNTFRENPDLQHPSDSFAAWATKELRREMGEYVLAVYCWASSRLGAHPHRETNVKCYDPRSEGRHLSDADLNSIACQEWRTDLTRNILETRLNRHGSKDGPVVRRSPSGVLYVTPQPAQVTHRDSSTTSPTKFVLDAIATPGLRKKAAAAPK
ncbi:hypothetical protein PHYPSEUDO_006734 [Phytophthora pseudosyringae]|uniref:Uncharacterized protein n=1 Tax=Phytophthora pseudosyringae TaxID=221518 RepID=A0A8T1VIC9_9STRA|nr:hypothetical protein PHYPSEUDO_006734 [Phytophthora pseudosyringae]